MVATFLSVIKKLRRDQLQATQTIQPSHKTPVPFPRTVDTQYSVSSQPKTLNPADVPDNPGIIIYQHQRISTQPKHVRILHRPPVTTEHLNPDPPIILSNQPKKSTAWNPVYSAHLSYHSNIYKAWLGIDPVPAT